MDPTFDGTSYPEEHSALLVGYSLDPDSGVPYWLLKNSFGPDWGEDGYFRVKRSSKDPCCLTWYKNEFPLMSSQVEEYEEKERLHNGKIGVRIGKAIMASCTFSLPFFHAYMFLYDEDSRRIELPERIVTPSWYSIKVKSLLYRVLRKN